MMRFPHPVQLAAAIALLAMAACCPAGKQLLGDPQTPYPPISPPKVGEIVHLPTGTAVSLAQMLAVAADARVVYIGETHDNPASHRLELATLRGLEERHPGGVALGMEMFSRSQQQVLDRWSAGELDEKQFLKEARWFDNWRMDFAYYRDLLIFARDRHIPLVALNAEKGLVQAVREKPLAELSAAHKGQLPEMDQADPYQRGMAQGIFGGHSHSEMHLAGFLRAQTLWDETMAESAARFLQSPQGKDRHLLVIAGANHISYGFGIPRRVFRRLPVSYLTIGGREIEILTETPPLTMDVELPDFPMVPYDFLAYLAYEDLPDKGVLLGVMYEPVTTGHGLQVTGVVPGSNAERAGVQKGDLLIRLDGEPLTDGYDLSFAIKQRHAGDRGVLRVERAGAELDLQVVFQPGEPHHGKP